MYIVYMNKFMCTNPPFQVGFVGVFSIYKTNIIKDNSKLVLLFH